MRLTYENGLFIARVTYPDRDVPRRLGFRWDSKLNVWTTESLAVAAKLRPHATTEAEEQFAKRSIRVKPWLGPLPHHYERLLPHQREGLEFLLTRKRAYLAFEPGLGKTAVAALAMEALKTRAVYVTPPFLIQNVLAELGMWTKLRAQVLTSKTYTKDFADADVIILPDTLLQAPHIMLGVHEFVNESRFYGTTLVVDEAHRFKSTSAKRTQALFGRWNRKGLAQAFDYRFYLSGTPMPNRPVELYAVLASEAPETIGFKRKDDYVLRYCGGQETQYGLDESGASNLDELFRNILYPTGPFMLRVKKDVLGLPPKLEQVFLLSATMPARAAAFDHEIAKHYKSGEDAIRGQLALKAELGDHEMPLATYRRVLGELKAETVVPYLVSLLEETNESIIVYAYHKRAVAVLFEALAKYEPYLITGATPMAERQAQVKDFQANTKRRLFVGNYSAMGVGFTLTKATRVVFVEFSWVPGDNDQASDRPHRIGQSNSVLVQYVTYQGSVDEAVIRTLLRKRKVINHV